MSAQQTQEVHPSQVVDITRDVSNGYYLKVFLLDDSINGAKWRIKTDYIPKHIDKFVGRPFILTKEHYHPLEFDSLNIDYNNIPDTVNRLLETQDKYKIGTIRKVERSINPAQAAYGATWNAYVEITDPTAIQAFKSGYTPRFVSASVFRLNQHESPQETTDFEPLHLAAVDNPAYGIHKAGVRGTCNGNLTTCSKQLAQASLTELTQEQKQADAAVLRQIADRYSSLVNSERTDASVNLTNDNAEQQQQPNVTQTNQTGTTPPVIDTVASPQSQSQLQQQPQPTPTQTQQLIRPTSGTAAPFEVQKQEQPKPVEQPQPQNNTVQDMANLMTKYEALLNRVNELETFKQTTQKTDEENKIATKRTKIENAIPADYAGSPEERTKAIENLMKIPDGPELDYFLAKFVTPLVAKPVEQAANEQNKTAFMRAKRVTDYATTKPTNKKAVAQASVPPTNTDQIDLSRVRRICSMTDIVSNTSVQGGRF